MTPATVEKEMPKRPIVREGMLLPVDPSFNFSNEDNQYWKCKYSEVTFTITPSTLVQDPVSGRILPRPGLSIGFSKGKWSIERKHPDRKLIEERLRISDTYKAGVLVCMDDIPAAKRHLIDPEQLGTGPRQRLAALGIHTDEHRAAIVQTLTEMNDDATAELKVEAKAKDQKIGQQEQEILALEEKLKTLKGK